MGNDDEYLLLVSIARIAIWQNLYGVMVPLRYSNYPNLLGGC